jgi:DNA gyrase subunit A
MEVIKRDSPATIITVCERGFGKRTSVEEYPLQHRAGQGVITIKTTERNGQVVAVLLVSDNDEIMIITDRGKIIRMKVSGISVIGRNTQGVRLINLEEGEEVTGVCMVMEQEENGEGKAESSPDHPGELPGEEKDIGDEDEGAGAED